MKFGKFIWMNWCHSSAVGTSLLYMDILTKPFPADIHRYCILIAANDTHENNETIEKVNECPIYAETYIQRIINLNIE